jgi:TfoX/Sxy family transcriptional regulator of competence genes
MQPLSKTPEECYAVLVASFLNEPAVTYGADARQPKRSFGAKELKIRGKIFAMLVRGRLVVKLPRARIDALVAAGTGERFDPRHDGRLMKEWLVIDPKAIDAWQPLATEALAFVGAHR